ncbi:zinc transporter 2-like [Oryza brachyantha]|uniref:Zinc transporter n=1 Tax=Oryza brachyantha TaxID=4533 RepID=J3LPQ8_ORYBR|nr:zinc transporter 2-like [Oryza brachyantha]
MGGGRGARGGGGSLHLLLLVVFVWLCATATTAWAHGGGGRGADSDADGGGEGEGKPDLRARGLVAAKLWCMLVVFAGTLAGGVSPYFMRWNEAFLVLGTQFAGGVFLGTAMMHFLSDANETFRDLLPDSGYPYAFMLACAGYVLTMFADCAISSVVARGAAAAATTAAAGGLEEGKLSSTNGNVSDPPAADAAARHGSSPDGHSVASMLRNASTLGDSVLLIAALCFHSVFEGIAIGVAETKADAWKALWTISLHKIFAAIAMGIALLRMLPNRPFLSCFGYAFAFAVSSPVGVAIGIVIDATTQGPVADWIFSVSMGIATGIFIYVSINHLLNKGYRPQSPVAADTPAGRLLAVVLGVAVIAVVMIWDT